MTTETLEQVKAHLECIQRLLSTPAHPAHPEPSELDLVLNAVTHAFCVSRDDLFSDKCPREIVDARWVAILLLHERGLCKDHGTVYNTLNRIGDKISTDRKFAAKLTETRNLLKL